MTGPAKNNPNSDRLTRGYLICLGAVFFWSFTAIFIRYLTETYHMPALPLAFWRDLLVFLALALVFAVFKPSRFKVQRRHLAFLALYGCELAAFNLLWTISVELNGAAVSTVLAYSSAGFTAVMAWRLFGERLDAVKLGAVALSLAGCVLVSGAYSASAWQVNPVGIVTGLLSGLGMAAYSLLGKESAHRSIDPWSALMYTFGFAAAALLLANLASGLTSGAQPLDNLLWLGDAWMGWLVLAALAVGPTIGGYGLYTVSLTVLPASIANLIATLEPALTTVLAYLLLGEILTRPQLIGSALIVGGLIWLRLMESRSGEVQAALPAI